MPEAPEQPAVAAAQAVFDRRIAPGRLLADDAGLLARACYDMAVRFHRGGKLIVFGNGGPSTDAQHVAVEFVHPVIVGKRALPAISFAGDAATLSGIARTEGFDAVYSAQLQLVAAPADIALGISFDGMCANVVRGLEMAREMGMLTIALTGGDGGEIARRSAAEHVLIVHCDDPCIVKEVHVTSYHVLWELVHVFFEQPGLLGPEVIR